MSVRIVAEPKVYLVGRQSIDRGDLSRFLSDEGCASWGTDTEVGAEVLVEIAGRTCYMSFARPRPGGNAAYVGHLLEVGHGSVLEHAVFNLVVAGVSRAFTHELVRHRAGFGYSQLSQRYVDEKDCEFIVPPALAEEVKAAREFMSRYGHPDPWSALSDMAVNLQDHIEGMSPAYAGLRWLAAMDRSREDYVFLSDYLAKSALDGAYATYQADFAEALAGGSVGGECPSFLEWTSRMDRDRKTTLRKAAREAARSVLPNATETKIFVTANARALRHFVEMRGSEAADAEMRRVALALLRVLQSEAPNLFGDYRIERTPEGIEHAVTGHRKT